MSLIIENGVGVDGADSFITVEEYNDIKLALFSDHSQGDATHKEAALRRAWYYMKSLDWVAEYPTFGGTVPSDIKTAQAVLARYEMDNVNGLSPSVVPAQQRVLNRVGEIGWSVTAQSGTNANRAVILMAQDLLKPFIKNTGATKFFDRG